MDIVLNVSHRDGSLFDDSFRQSKVYFSIDQLLRIVSDWITQTRRDLQVFDAIFLENPVLLQMSAGLAQNWRSVSAYVETVDKRLQERISSKKDEIMSLRDGVSENQIQDSCSGGNLAITDIRILAVQCYHDHGGIEVDFSESARYCADHRDSCLLASQLRCSKCKKRR